MDLRERETQMMDEDTDRVDVAAADILANTLRELNMLNAGFGPGGDRYTVDSTGLVRRGEATELSPYAHVEAAIMVALSRLAGTPERAQELRRHLFDGDTTDVLARLGENWAHEDAESMKDGAGGVSDDPGSGKVRFAGFSLSAAFGVEWNVGASGTRYQLVNPRGTTTLFFGLMVQGAEQWSTTPVIAPERFGMHTPPHGLAGFRKIAEAYVDASSSWEENESS
jgi:hypothetical protein